MKKIYGKLIGGAVLALMATSLVSCDDVKEGDRYILGEEIKAERNVLLEDFTGQTCINCPDAHKIIEQLEEQYGDKMIAVSIHCGTFGIDKRRTNFSRDYVGLMTSEGNAIMQAYGIQSFPMGVIDMGTPMTFDLWPTGVRDALQVSTDVQIKLHAEYVPDETQPEEGYAGNINITAEVMSGTTRMANLQFWIVESNIVALQRYGNQTITDYVHNNVFRAQVFDGIRGEQVNLTAGFEQQFDGSIATRWTNAEHWEIGNLAVVAFVSDNKGVLQVERIPLFPKEDDTTPGE